MDEITVRKVSELLDVSYPTALNFAREHGRRVDGRGRFGRFLVPVEAVRAELGRKRAALEHRAKGLADVSATPEDDYYDVRSDEMTRLRDEELWTLQEIGDKFGISRERVRQIIGNTGHGYVGKRNREGVLDTLDMTHKEAAAALGVKYQTAVNYRSDYRTPVEPDCAIGVGRIWEDYAVDDLRSRGIDCEPMTSCGAPYDIKLDNGLRIDVKYCSSGRRKTHPRMVSPQWGFQVGKDKKPDGCDFFYCITENKDVFIIPAKVVPENMNVINFCYPSLRPSMGKYQKYHERYDLLSNGTPT